MFARSIGRWTPVLVVTLAVGCSLFGGDEEEKPVPVVEESFDLSMATESDIDSDAKNQNQVGPGSYGGYWVTVKAGVRYFLQVEVASGGGVSIHVGPNSKVVIGGKNVQAVSAPGGTWITPDWSGRMYVLVRATTAGTTVISGVYTYDPSAGIPSKAVRLAVNDVRTDGKLLKGQNDLYYFEAKAGRKYKIHPRVFDGKVNVYAGPSPTVGPDNYKFADAYGDDGIELQYEGAVTVFVSVEDQDSNLGSEYSIRVYSLEEENGPVTGVQPLVVNDVRTEGVLMPGEVKRFSFPMVHGRTYRVIPHANSGKIDLFAGELSCVDNQVHSHADLYGDDGIELLASEEPYPQYVAVVDPGNDLGSKFSLRVISYDEASPSVPNSDLLVGSTLEDQSVSPGEVRRYRVLLHEGSTYRIHVAKTEGALDAYFSSIASVDEQVHEKADLYGDDDIVVLATKTADYYVAVISRRSDLAAGFSISLTQD